MTALDVLGIFAVNSLDFVKRELLLPPHTCEWQPRALWLCTALLRILFGARSKHTAYASVSRRVLTAEAWFRYCTAVFLNHCGTAAW